MVVISIRTRVTWFNDNCAWAYTHTHTHTALTVGITWGTSKGIWDVLPSGWEIIFEIPHPAFSPYTVWTRTQRRNTHTHTHTYWTHTWHASLKQSMHNAPAGRYWSSCHIFHCQHTENCKNCPDLFIFFMPHKAVTVVRTFSCEAPAPWRHLLSWRLQPAESWVSPLNPPRWSLHVH